MKNVTLKEVAKEAGVSVMSVSKALNNKEGLSDETRRRILEIAAQMNYSQNQVACSLRTGATRTIGVVLSDSAESVVARVLRGIQDEARRNGYSVIITNTDKQPELEYDAIQSLIDKRIDGLILVAPKCYTEERLMWIQGFGIPTVIAMRHGERGQNTADAVLNNNYDGGYEVVSHLLAQGCRRPVFLHLQDSRSSRERSDGYASALREYGLSLESFPQLRGRGQRGSGPCRGAGDPRPAGSARRDRLRLRYGRHRRHRGAACRAIRIPEQIRVTGYDGIEFGAYLKTPLTTIAQPLYEIGMTSAQLLVERIKKPASPAREILLQSKLVVRESTGGASAAQPIPTTLIVPGPALRPDPQRRHIVMNNEHKYLQWFSSQTKSIYWHDSAVRAEQQAAFANGATGMTTNPFLIQSTLNGDRAFWAERLAATPAGSEGPREGLRAHAVRDRLLC